MGDLNQINVGISADSLLATGTEQTDLGGAIGANLQFVTNELLVEAFAGGEFLLPVTGTDSGDGTFNLAFHLAFLGNISPDVWLGGRLGMKLNIDELDSNPTLPSAEAGALVLANVTDTFGLSAFAGVSSRDFQDVLFSGSLGVRFSWDVYDSSDLSVGEVATSSRPDPVIQIEGLELIQVDGTNTFSFDPLILRIETDGPADVEIFIINATGKRVHNLGTHEVNGFRELMFLSGENSLPKGSAALQGTRFRVVVRVVNGDGLQYGTWPFNLFKTPP